MKQFFKFFIVFLFFFGTHFSQASELITAIKNEYYDEIARLIDDETIDVNAQDEHKETALLMLAFRASYSKRYNNFIEKLLKRKANVNIGDENNTTAIYLACDRPLQPNLQLVKLLLSHNAHVNTTTVNSKFTPLMKIINEEKLRRDYDKLPELDPQPQSIEEYIEIIHLLLDAGADTTIKNHKGKTVFDMASPEILEILNQRTQQAHQERDAALCNMKLLNPAPTNQPYRCNAMALERTLQFLGTSNYPTK